MTNTTEARFENSTICNYNCVFCPLNDGDFNRKKTTMSNQLFKTLFYKLMDEAPHIEDITISGMGEPTLDDGYIEKLEIIKSKNLHTNMLSNGSKFKFDDIDYVVKSGILDSIRFSIHSLDKEHYKETTGSDSLDLVLKNIEEFIFRKELYNSNMRIIVSADIIPEHSGDEEELIKHFSNRVDLLEIWRPHNWVDWAHYRHGGKKKTTCGRPFNGPLQIQVDGTINMCCFDYNGDLLLGDFKNQSLKEIFQSDMYERILDFHKGNHNNSLICNACDQLFEKDSNVMIYNSKFDVEKRIHQTSTLYKKLD